MENYLVILFFLFLGAIVAGTGILISMFISFKSPESDNKRTAYECGADLIGDAHIQFKVGFYLFALLFLVFDIESLFLFPCMKIFTQVISGDIVGIQFALIFWELTVFILILFGGLLYAWRKGALKWE